MLWNMAEWSEKRCNSTVAREWELALPARLPAAGRQSLVARFCRELVLRYGVAVDAAIHLPGKDGDERIVACKGKGIMGLILAVLCGGGIGSLTRHYVIAAVNNMTGSHFPYGTMVVNVVGSLIIGVLMETMALKWQVSLETRAFLVTGFLGGFTTFSTFSFDTYRLVDTGQYFQALLYILFSVGISFTVLFAAVQIVRRIFA